MSTGLDDTLTALHAFLDRRVREVSDEVSHYPTPIARCDDQLPGLIEQRGRLMSRFRALRAIVGNRSSRDEAAATQALAELLDGYGRSEDDEEATLLSKLTAEMRMPTT